MPGRFEPHRTTLEGVEVVILAPEAYERLLGYRRQLGGQAAQFRSLKQTLADANAQLDRIDQLVQDAEAGAADPASTCARIAEVLLGRPDPNAQRRKTERG
jgi:hypothetical protein